MDVRLAVRYRLAMWLLLPLTLGIGTAVLWLFARPWPSRVDESGIRLRDGNLLNWNDIAQLRVTRRNADTDTQRLTLYKKGGGTVHVPVKSLEHGERVAGAIRAHFKSRDSGLTRSGNSGDNGGRVR